MKFGVARDHSTEFVCEAKHRSDFILFQGFPDAAQSRLRSSANT
jgi:hypothetical protein